MRLYNTLTKRKEEFIPLEAGKVKMYGCGPTVYNLIHVGNARASIVFDVLRQYLEFSGYSVVFAQNFTDVDDKIIRRAAEEGVSTSEIAEKYISEYKIDAEGLNIKPATIQPRATESIPEIIQMVQGLVASGHAYAVGGDVYYDVRSFPGYGKLSGQPLEDLESGARIEVGEQKKSPADFALWKAAKPGEPSWESPWGKGRPGWHIECSAMCQKHLGKTIDIHGGGIDLIFPHHENEIAQSEAACGCTFANYWVHNGFITVNNEKMGKSLNNFFMVRDAAKVHGYEPIRYFLLSAHYRSPLNYSEESLRQSKAALQRLHTAFENLGFIIGNGSDAELSDEEKSALAELESLRRKFIEAMEDDLNTADAIAAIFEMVRVSNSALSGNPGKKFAVEAERRIRELLSVLGLSEFIVTPVSGGTADANGNGDSEIEALIEARQAARKAKNFAEADRIRDELKAMGVVLEDTPQGVKWRKM
ncbi:MAG: cysteine--tRNA ligase [Oscillospiraceae bacterium]|nr:cysteine--tRNA ligase [Oscillospiraceae bacterium]